MLNTTNTHDEHKKLTSYWERCRAAYAGEKEVHDKKTDLLPEIEGQTEAQYNSYRLRARFFNAVRRTVDGLTGLVFRKEPIVKADGLEEFTKDVTMHQQSMSDYCQGVIAEVLTVGGGGTLVEHPKMIEGLTVAQAEKINMRPMFKFYTAENILNWRYEIINNVSVLVEVVLEEEYQDDNGDHRKQIRNLYIEDSQYLQKLTRDNPKEGEGRIEIITPLMNGKKITYIPFVFHRTKPGLKYELPPLTDLVDTNIHHYQLEADHAHGLRYVALPTPYITGATGPEETGVDEDGNPIKAKQQLGPYTILYVPDVSSKVGMLEFSGQGLMAIREQLSKLESTMAQQGAKVLQPETTGGFETATQSVIGAKGETSLLSRITNSVSSQMTTALRYASEWMNKTNFDDYEVELSTDFLPVPMSAQDLTALTQSWLSGGMSYETYFNNLKKGEVINGEASYEDEKEKISTENPQPNSNENLDDEE